MRAVDVSSKPETHRHASAYGRIRLSKNTIKLIREKRLPKGDLVEATKLTGIFGAKRTGEILPFCHPIPFDFVEVDLKVGEDRVEVFSRVSGIARTGYEMEALTAVSVALLNVYDMCKGVDDSMVIEEIKLTAKGGGKSDWKGDLKGVKVSVFSEDRALEELVKDYLTDLGAELVEEGGDIEIFVGKEIDITSPMRAMESVVALYDFSRDPTEVSLEVGVGKGDRGQLVISIPASEGKIKTLFETFGGILGRLL